MLTNGPIPEALFGTDGTTMIFLIFKFTNITKKMVVSNLKYETDRETISKFLNKVKDLLDDISSNYTIIIDKGVCHED